MTDVNLPLHGCYDCQNQERCEWLRRRIDELINRNKHTDPPSEVFSHDIHGLRHRFPEQINGRYGPGMVDERGRVPWDTHDDQIRGQQGQLEDALEEYERNGCGPPPPGAWEWATRPAPRPSEWQGSVDEGGLSTGETVALAAGGTALGYLGYRALRMLPSILFPPSAVPNLLIP